MDRWAVFIFLGAGSGFDYKKHSIPAGLLGGFLLAGIFFQTGRAMMGSEEIGKEIIPVWSWIAGGIVGILLLGVGKVSRQAIGYGDALAIAVTGIWLGFFAVIEIFFLGLLAAAVYSGWLFAVKRINGRHSFAFLPFLMGGYLVWLWLMGGDV